MRRGLRPAVRTFVSCKDNPFVVIEITVAKTTGGQTLSRRGTPPEGLLQDPGNPVSPVSDSLGLEHGLIICISNEFPGDSDLRSIFRLTGVEQRGRKGQQTGPFTPLLEFEVGGRGSGERFNCRPLSGG